MRYAGLSSCCGRVRRLAIALAWGVMFSCAVSTDAVAQFNMMTPLPGTTPPQQQPSAATPQSKSDKDFQSLLQAAERGNADAQVKVALAYYLGQNNSQLTPQQKTASLALAAKWARAAAEQGSASGQAFLGMFYEAGLGVPQNRVEAVRLYRLSAAQGAALGQLSLGKAFLNGSGVPQDYTEARDLLLKAAAQNNAEAENFLGVMYAQGKGVPKDLTESLKW
jgi:TPR repeat protein